MTHSVPQWSTGWRMRRAMAEARVSRLQVARHLKVSEATVSRWLHDDVTVPEFSPKTGVHYMSAFADLTGVPVEWLLTGASPVDEAEDELLIERHRQSGDSEPGNSVNGMSPTER